ncbi:MAG: glycosyltransferase family 4 protein, partial [Candidatus Hodarchaeota archaeon]
EFGIPKDNVSVIYNGLDHELYKPNPILKSPYPHIVYLGRIKKYKNIVHLLRAMKSLVNLKQLSKVKLSIAGRGDYEELKKAVEELGLSNYVELLGEVSDLEKVKLYNKGWVYVSASSREGWGLTVIEANACGTPAIAYRVPGLRNTVIDGKTGLLVPHGDVRALGEAMLRMLTDDELRFRLSRGAIEWAKQFSWEWMAEEVLHIVELALKGVL